MFTQHLAKLLLCIFLAASLKSPSLDKATRRTQADGGVKALGNPGTAPSEEAKSVLRGTVVDHTGSVVPNFTVEIHLAPSGSPVQTPASSVQEVQTNEEGEFSATLPPGSYRVCVARFPKSCRTILVEKAPKSLEYQRLEISPSDDHASSELLDIHIRRIAGPNAADCGRVQSKDTPKRATSCALRAYKRRKGFYVRYDDKGIGDSEGAHGIAGDANGKVYSVAFDGMGMATDHLPSGATMPDGFHTIIIPCSQPVRFRVSRATGELICFANDRWLGDK